MMEPKNIHACLVDGDMVLYRAAWATNNKPWEDCVDAIDSQMARILQETVVFPDDNCFQVWLTGKENFRFDVAKSYPYKGNRKETAKPIHLNDSRDYLQEVWDARVSVNCEADDEIVIAAYNLPYDLEAVVIASLDKDFKTVPCWKYDWIKGTYQYQTPVEALQFFYQQVLMGDNSDNIVGLYNVGPKKSAGMLEGMTTEEDMFNKCMLEYGDFERVVENARLLHLQRYRDQLWEPPFVPKGITYEEQT